MSGRVFVAGVGMTKFHKPGKSGKDYPELSKEAVTQCLADAGVPFEAVEQAIVSYVYGDSTCGQRAVYESGLTGIPVMNVNNNCSSGSTALFMAKQLVQGGVADCVLALGFEKMQRGSLTSHFQDRTNPMDKHVGVLIEERGMERAPMAAQLFGAAGLEHMEKYGTTARQIASIAAKNHRHSAENPRSQFRDIYTVDQILAAPKVYGPLTKLACCPTSDGAAAALVVSERFAYKYGLQRQAVEIVGMAMSTDTKDTFESKSMANLVGASMTRRAAAQVYKQSGLSADDCQVVELHDCFAANELITYEALGLCGEGKAGEYIDRGDNTYGGRHVVNPSGGLISKGHPLGATGLAQCAELCWQLRGMCGKRQVKGAKVALQHNLGLGGAAVVTMYKRANLRGGAAVAPGSVSRSESLGVAAPVEVAPPKAAPAAAAPAGAAGDKVAALFKGLQSRISGDLVKKVGVVYKFDVDGRKYLVDLKNGNGALKIDDDGKADCTISTSGETLLKLFAGKARPEQLFMQGKLKIKGNMMLAQKLSLLMETKSKL